MSLQKLARELDETARQTAALVDSILGALEKLTDRSVPVEQARRQAMSLMISALRAHDGVEQRCQNMALAVRQFALLPPSAPESVYDEIWSSLILDELRPPELSGAPQIVSSGEADLI